MKVTSIPADDIDAHRTEIILVDVRPRARDILRSKDRWLSVLGQDDEPDVVAPEPPPYHSGYIAASKVQDEVLTYDVEPKLPWEADDQPLTRMQKLFDALAEEVVDENSSPELRTTLDEYLATVSGWTSRVGRAVVTSWKSTTPPTPAQSTPALH